MTNNGMMRAVKSLAFGIASIPLRRFCAAYKKYRPRPAKPALANTATADVGADESPTAWLRYKCRKQLNPKTRGTRRPSAMLPRHSVLPRQIHSGASSTVAPYAAPLLTRENGERRRRARGLVSPRLALSSRSQRTTRHGRGTPETPYAGAWCVLGGGRLGPHAGRPLLAKR